VIGGNGFLGASLVDALVQAGYEVTAFDRFSRGVISYRAADVRRIQGDFLNSSDLERALQGQEFVFHFLSTTTPASAEDEPALDISTNVSQTIRLLELSARAGVARFYYASSGGAIYGSQGRLRLSEADLTQPVSPYGIGKLTVEKYLDYFEIKRGLRSIALRISNPYGPGQSPRKGQGLVSISIDRVRRNKPVLQMGDGQMVRDYIYVDDLVKMIVDMTMKAPRASVYNMGSGTGHSVNAIFESIRSVAGFQFPIVPIPQPPTFVQHVVLDTSRFRSEYGDYVTTDLQEGIRRTWEAFSGSEHSGFRA